MIGALSKRMASFFIQNGFAEEENRELYEFGVGLLLATILGYGVILAVALVFGNIWLGVLYLAAIVPLRIYCGGYHASTHFRCNLMFALVFAADLLLYQLLCAFSLFWVMWPLLVFAVICTVWLAPVAHKNHPLSEQESKKYRRMSLMLLFSESIGAILVGLWSPALGLFIAMALFVVSTLMILAVNIERGITYEKNYKQRRKTRSQNVL